MIQPGIIYDNPEDNITISGAKMSFSVNKEIQFGDEASITPDQSKKKRGRPKTKSLGDGTIMVTSDSDSELSNMMTNTPYNESYEETNNMLKSVIIQSDMMSSAINKDLADIRSSRTLKKKYDYISLLSSTSSALLGTKVTAIRELNKSITESHNLELKRTKELKLTQNEQDDDKRIMDMYNAFISTPMGVGPGMNFVPPSQELTYAPSGSIDLSFSGGEDTGYDKYLNNLSPAQNMMRYESNPNIKTVVRYDSNTGARSFDVIDLTTGASIPNASIPPALLLEDITIDLRNGIARNSNLDTTYPLIVTGNRTLEEY